MFKTETHLHTAEVSKCARVCAADLIAMYHEAGYSTVFVSDHFQTNTLDSKGDIPWEEKIDSFLEGYRVAKDAGDKLGVTVLPCAEFRLADSSNHFLVYGISREFLVANPEMHKLSAEEFAAIAHEWGLYIVHAHPFRDSARHPKPELVDAIEVYNSNPRHENNTDLAEELARSLDLPVTAGSDTHRTEDVACSGVATEYRIETAEDYIRAVRDRQISIIKRDGEEI